MNALLAAYTKDPLNQAKTDAYTKADAKMTQEDAWSAETDIKTILTQLHIGDLTARVGVYLAANKSGSVLPRY